MSVKTIRKTSNGKTNGSQNFYFCVNEQTQNQRSSIKLIKHNGSISINSVAI